MATKEEIIAAIQTGIARVEGTFGGLTDEQLGAKVHSEEAGWTARDILTHLAGREQVYQAINSMADGDAPFGGGFSVNDWNQSKVDERAGKSREELLGEFRAVHTALIGSVQAMSDERLGKAIQTPRGETTLGDMLRGSGGVHSVTHSAEVEQALGLGGAGE